MLSTTANEMLEGVISVSPLKDKDIDACAYCDFKSVCGFDQKLATPRQKDEMNKETGVKVQNDEGDMCCDK